MTYEQLRELSRTKALEAVAELELEAPDEAKAKALQEDADKYRVRAEKMAAMMTIAKNADAEKAAGDEAEPGGFKVVEDEADKKAKGKAGKWSFGEFLIAVSKDEREIQSYKSTDPATEYGYDMGKAVGEKAIGSLTQAKAITGLSETVPADGGFLVGVDHNASLMSRVYNVGDLLRRVDMVGIGAGSNGMTFNAEAETSRANGARRGGILAHWACEAADKTPTHPTFRRLELNLNKVIGLVYATDELLQDATALEGWIMSNLPEELRFVVEDAIINGPGGGMPLGIMASPCLIPQPAEPAQAITTIVSENIINMWSRRWAGARDYVWLIHQDVTPQLHQMNLGVGAGGQLTYMPPGGLSGVPYGTIYGRPVLETEYAQTLGVTGDIILASLSEYQMIEKGGMQSASSIHVRFTNDETVFRFVYRCDGEPKWNLPLTPHHGLTTVSPFISLAGRP